VAWTAGQLRCPHCRTRFPSVDGVLDLRLGLEVERDSWRLEAFERAYAEVGCYRDHYDWARRSGIPTEVEDYRYPRIKGWLIDQVAPQRGQALLDVGCGSGFLLFDLRRRHPGLRLCGIDVSLAHLASLARRKRDDHITDILALASDGEDLPFPDGTFDWVTCSEVLEHIHAPEQAIREMYRVLKPGGTLLITTPNRAAVLFWEAVFRLPRAFRRLFRRGTSAAEGAYDEPLSAPRLRRAVERAGLVVEEFRSALFLPHESYFQFFPPWLVRFWLWRARFIERHLSGLLHWQGLHHLVRARKPECPPARRPRPARVLYVIDDLFPGGSERVLVDTALGLSAHIRRRANMTDRYQVSVLTLFAGGPLVEELQQAGVPVNVLGLSRWNFAAKALVFRRELRQWRPTIVHLFRVGSRVFAGPLAWAAGVPHVIGRWGSLPGDAPLLWKWLDRLSSHFITRSEACSRAVARALHRDFLPGRLATDVIHNATSLRSLSAGARRKARLPLGLSPQELAVGTVANLNWRKGHAFLLWAFAKVVSQQPGARLLLVGEGPLRESLEDLTRELRLTEDVRFLGRRTDVADLLPALDLFVLPSVTEGLGVALMEAMAVGLPCVATRVGGVPEVVADGETGLLVPPRDPEALAEAMLRLLPDTALRRWMGQAGRRRVEEHFSIERMVADVERMYSALLAREGTATDSRDLPATPPSSGADGERERAQDLGPGVMVSSHVRKYQGPQCGHPPRISVIVPSLDGYRRGNVPLLLSDLAGQAEQDFEVLVVIGVRPNGRARNVGAGEARGRYLVFIDDDVRLGDEHVLENLVRPFEERSGLGLTGASQLLPSTASAFEVRAAHELPRSRFPVQEGLVDTDQVSHLCLAMPRELYRQLGGENEEIPSGTDPDLRDRVRRAGLRVAVVPRTWAYHPGPRSLRELLGISYRKARDSRWVARHLPGLALDLSVGVGGKALGRRSTAWRGARLAGQVLWGLLEVRLLFVAARLAWAGGWLHERLRPRQRVV